MNFAASIIICTCNRARDLSQTLSALENVCVPEDISTELIVVDNASTDDTAEVVKSCCIPNMQVRYIHEPRQGKGYAYNTGMAAAQGQVFLFTDDDVRPPQNWIEGMCRPILAGEAEAIAGGVRFAPHLERTWMQPKHRSVLASSESLNPTSPEYLIGANMAFSRHVLENVPLFDPALGPGALGFVDETLFSFQLKEAGYQIASALDVEVEHHFQKSRLLRASFLQTGEKMGQSLAYLAYHWSHSEPKHLLIHWMKLTLQLKHWRSRNRQHTQEGEGISITELNLVTSIHFYKYLCGQRQRSRCYTKHGLIKQVKL